MPSRTPVPASPVMDPASTSKARPAPAPAVLDRIAARVQQRLTAEQAASNRVGDGAHAASLIWPWPL